MPLMTDLGVPAFSSTSTRSAATSACGLFSASEASSSSRRDGGRRKTAEALRRDGESTAAAWLAERRWRCSSIGRAGVRRAAALRRSAAEVAGFDPARPAAHAALKLPGHRHLHRGLARRARPSVDSSRTACTRLRRPVAMICSNPVADARSGRVYSNFARGSWSMKRLAEHIGERQRRVGARRWQRPRPRAVEDQRRDPARRSVDRARGRGGDARGAARRYDRRRTPDGHDPGSVNFPTTTLPARLDTVNASASSTSCSRSLGETPSARSSQARHHHRPRDQHAAGGRRATLLHAESANNANAVPRQADFSR